MTRKGGTGANLTDLRTQPAYGLAEAARAPVGRPVVQRAGISEGEIEQAVLYERVA